MAYNILGVGSPCVDILYRVDDQFLADHNIAKGDGTSTTWKHFSSVLDACKKLGYEPVISTGGSTANTMKGLASLGHQVRFYGMVGDDSIAAFLKEKFSQASIHPLLKTTNAPTSQIGVFVTPDHQRSFVSFAGANKLIVEEPLTPELFSGIDWMHLEGYMIDELGISYVEKLLRYAKSLGVQISIDMGCAHIAKTYSKDILRLISTYITVTFSNQDEVAALLDMHPQDGCEKLAELCRVAVVGIGKDGCWVASGGECFKTDAIKVEAVDTTGAGDLFACGFIHSLIHGYSLQKCAQNGNLLGGTVVTHIGAEIPKEEWPRLRSFLDVDQQQGQAPFHHN